MNGHIPLTVIIPFVIEKCNEECMNTIHNPLLENIVIEKKNDFIIFKKIFELKALPHIKFLKLT